MIRRLTLWTLILLALLLPVELEVPWLRVGPVALTNLELVQWAALALATVAWLQAGRPRPPLPRSWVVWGLLFVTFLFLSSLLAPAFSSNALKAALRTLAGIALALAVAVTLRSRRDFRLLVIGLVAGGFLAAVIGIAEVARGADFSWLFAFRPAPSVAGPFLRLSGPFDYTNQAAMYVEAVLPMLLALAYWARKEHRWTTLLLAALVLLLYLLAAVLTFSRATLASLIMVNLALAVTIAWRNRAGPRRLAGAFATLAVLTALFVGGNALLNPVFGLRFTGESDSAWYQVGLQVPSEFHMEAGKEQMVPVAITNEGAFTWHSTGTKPIYLGARWVRLESGEELVGKPRWFLPQPLVPGETVTMEVGVAAPLTAGDYRLEWDMVQEGVAWFGAKTGNFASSRVKVEGDVAQMLNDEDVAHRESFQPAGTRQAPIPGRLLLWQVARDLWQERPLLGVGLDNFRLLYGVPLGYDDWNTSIHTNNWYVETVVSLGLLGAFPFLILLVLLLWDIGCVLRRATVSISEAAVAAGLLAYMVHGLLDYFLLFNATGLLFWMLIGMWLVVRAPEVGVSSEVNSIALAAFVDAGGGAASR